MREQGIKHTVTYGRFRERSLKVLACLHKQGMTRGSLLILSLQRNEDILMSFWACILGGIIPVPIAHGMADDHKQKIKHLFEDLVNPYLIVDDAHFDRLTDYFQREEPALVSQLFERRVKIDFDSIESLSETALVIPEILPQDIAYIQYSSGSTSRPRGIKLTHQNLVSNARDIASRSLICEMDHTVSWMPLHHDMGMIAFHLTSLLANIHQTLIPTELFIRRPLLWMDIISEQRATLLYSPNFGLRYLLSALHREGGRQYDLGSVRVLYNGAEMISPKICFEFEQELSHHGLQKNVILPSYGLAEASVAVACPNPGESLRVHVVRRSSLQLGCAVIPAPDGSDDTTDFVEVGYAMDSTEIRISSEGDEVLPDRHLGLIQVKGASVTTGYYRKDQELSSTFTKDGWLRTGDIGFLVGQRLVIVGRFKQMIIVNGQNYYPHDLEKVLIEKEGLETGKVVVTSYRKNHNEQILVFIYHKGPVSNFLKTSINVNNRLLRTIGIAPQFVIPVNKIPKTTSGKIQHYKLIDNFESGSYQSALNTLYNFMPEPSNRELHHSVAALMSRFLGENNAGDQTFFGGLNSLDTIRLIAELNHKFNVSIRPQDIIGKTSVAQLSTLIESKSPNEEKRYLNVEEEQDHYPLRPSQQRLYVLHEKFRDARLNIATAYEVTGKIDTDRMKVAFNALIESNQILQSKFAIYKGEPRILYSPNNNPSLSSCIVINEQSPNIVATFEQYANSTFDLATAPLVRLIIMKESEHRSWILLVIHHLISDGWSVEQMWQRLFQHYAKGEATAPMKYSLQQSLRYFFNNRSTGSYDDSRAYWLAKYAHSLPIIHLPQRQYAGSTLPAKRISRRIPLEMLKKIELLVGQLDVSYHSFMQSVFNLTVVYFSGSNRFCVSTEFVNRHSPDSFEQLGYLINTLLIETTVDQKVCFADYITEFHKAFRGDQSYGDFEIDELFELRKNSLNASLAQATAVLFLYQDFNRFSHWQQIGEIQSMRRFQPFIYIPLVPLQFECIKLLDGFELELKFDTNAFTEGFCQALLQTYATILEMVIQRSNVSLGELLAQITGSYPKRENSPQLRPIPTSEDNVIDQFTKSCAIQPDAVAVVHNDCAFTYGYLDSVTNTLAANLQSNYGIGKGDLIPVHLSDSWERLLVLLSVFKSGAVYVPLDTTYPFIRKEIILAETSPRLIIGEDEAENLFSTTVVKVESLFDENPIFEPVEHSGNDIAYILFTSGTTGVPKGVIIEHDSLAAYVKTFAGYFLLSPNDKVIHQSSPGFDTSMEEIFPILLRGGQLVTLGREAADVQNLLQVIEREQATILSSTPLIVNEINAILCMSSSLRTVISGGDVLKFNHVDKLVDFLSVYNTYGPSETTVCVTYGKVNSPLTSNNIGKPIDTAEIFIVNKDIQVVSPYQVGQLLIGGRQLARGYFHDDTLTNEKFITWDYQGISKRVFQSGDYGFWNDDGSITFAGRMDGQVKINGYRIEMEEVEQTLRSHSMVKDALVVAQERQDKGNMLVAYVILNQPSNTYDDLRGFLLSRLPHYMVPTMLIEVSEWPRTAHGKINRDALPKTESLPHVEHHQTDSLVQHELKAIWETVFGNSIQDVNADFFALGGNSLTAIKLAVAIQKRWGKVITMADIFNHHTTRKLADYIESQQFIADLPYLPVHPYQTSHAQQRMLLLEKMNYTESPYRVSATCILKGDVNPKLLALAISDIVQRHENFRTTFHLEEGALRQRIHASIDLASAFRFFPLGAADSSIALELFMGKPFDLETGPLMRLALIEEKDHSFTLRFTIHHVIFDEHSAALLVQDLFRLYMVNAGYKKRDEIPVTTQYSAYAKWEARHLAAHGNRLAAFWKKKLSGHLPTLQLPFSRSRPKERSFVGEQLIWEFSSAQSNSIARMAEESGCTPFMILLSIVYFNLYNASGATDFIIGTSISQRDRPEFQNLIGLCLNQLPIRIQLNKDLTLSEFFQYVMQEVIESYSHKEYPLDLMAIDLNLARNPSRSPLFDVTVDMGLPTVAASEQADVPFSITLEPQVQTASKFDFSMHFDDQKGLLVSHVVFNTALFHKDDMQDWMMAYGDIVTQLHELKNMSLQRAKNKIDHHRKSVLLLEQQRAKKMRMTSFGGKP